MLYGIRFHHFLFLSNMLFSLLLRCYYCIMVSFLLPLFPCIGLGGTLTIGFERGDGGGGSRGGLSMCFESKTKLDDATN